jgi:hypothetical protein
LKKRKCREEEVQGGKEGKGGRGVRRGGYLGDRRVL